MQAVAQVDAVAGLGRLGRAPVGGDVVEDLVVGGHLHQLDGAATPLAQRLDPGGGPAVIGDAVEIVVELAVALQQAEAARALVEEAGDGGVRGVDERPPDALAGAGP